MGIVARCTHLALNEQVAIKMLRHDVLMDQDATSRFMREAQAAVKLRSEYVARVSDVGTLDNGVPFMVMEYLDGQDLGVLLEEQGTVAAQWATDLMLQACEALAEAHSINIVHRDVKPTNLFVTWRPDGTSLIKVLDFGISQSPMGTDMQLTQPQSLLGTPAYMSPEQMRSARLVDGRSDIWSLGTVMYELIEGRRPFEADSFSEMCVKVAVDPPSPMVNTPPALQHVVLRCLAKSPEQRYPSMAELGRDLIPFARDPHGAQAMVDRMFRLLGRASTPSWEGSGTGVGIRTPVRGIPREPGSGPVRAQSPVAAWHGHSDPAAPTLGTMKEASAPAVLPIDVSLKKKRSSVAIIAVVATLCIAAGVGGVLVFNNATAEEQPAKVEPAPGTSEGILTPPPTAGSAPATAVKAEPTPPPPPVEDKAAVDKTQEAAIEIQKPDDVKKPDTTSRKEKDRKPKNPRIKKQPYPPPAVETAKQPEKKPEGKDLVKPEDTRPTTKEDLYSRPRPKQPTSNQ